MADYKKLSEGERMNLVQNAILNKVNTLLDMFPGYRGYRRGIENAIGMAQGQPNRYSAGEYAKDLGYSVVPFYGAYDDYINNRPQDWSRNAVEAALIGLPLNGPHGVRRTDPKRVPVDEARTAEFNQKLNDLTDLNADDRMFRNILLEDNSPILPITNVNNNGIKSLLERHGLGEYYDDIIFRNDNVNPNYYFNPERLSYIRERPEVLGRDYNNLLDEYEHNFLYENRDGVNLDKVKEYYDEAAQRYNVDKGFEEFLNDYYDRNNMNAYLAEGIDDPHAPYEYTPGRMRYVNELRGNAPIRQETINEYINQTLIPSNNYPQDVIDILKSDIPKEEKKRMLSTFDFSEDQRALIDEIIESL